MINLFDKLSIGVGLTLKNRIVFPPMCNYRATLTGESTKFHEIHYGTRALGGTGFIIVEATAVEERGRISTADLGLWHDNHINSHKKITDVCHRFGAKVAIQIAHAGRKSGILESAIAPCTLSFSDKYNTPHFLSTVEIQEVQQAFVLAAERAEKSNYDAIEIHAAHGYLINSFLSPLSNTRNDHYGGSFKNRIRFLKEIIEKIKAKVTISIGVRISATEWASQGWTLEDSIALCKSIEDDVDFIHVSAGGNTANPDLMPEIKALYMVPYAKIIKEKVKIPVIAVGLITRIEEANTILKEGKCDLVAFGRELIRNPNLPQFAARKMDRDEFLDSSYLRSFN